MEFRIKKCVAWSGELTSEADWIAYANGQQSLSTETTMPGLKQIPAMQRRRLSPFAKIALHCALEASEEDAGQLATVFSSRHGDLHKTSKLIGDVAAKESLSPTQFGLSVHNAVGGQFSIFAKNKAPLTATSAGEDTFLMAIVDAVCKLNSHDYDQILVVYTDEIVPTMYSNYVEQDEVTVGAALVIEKSREGEQSIRLDMAANPEQECENKTMQVFDFLSFLYGNDNQRIISSKRHTWTLSKD